MNMGLVCPDCNSPGSLRIKLSLEIPPDSRSDEISIQLLECPDCGFHGVGVYEESRRGRLDDEAIDHYGYYLDTREWKRLAGILRACPNPRDKKCTCQSHKRLNVRNQYGRWSGLEGFELGRYVTMEYQR